ncbi:MAG: T9SS C-terminal target domain-containing protein [Calditrichaeota bacterium]|nr:MAG: T9SS C-terminal target domain-containing protein [Calditrichota bacterium]
MPFRSPGGSRKSLVLLFLAGLLIYSFCILTSSQGFFRRYLDSDIPFVYKINNTAPSNFIAMIDSGAQVWEDVPSSYWEFENGGLTAANDDIRDGINLVFFDFQGINFAPGTNTIAFSRTWTQGSGSSFHAVESDLIWNARDFPPSPTGAPGQQDLWSTMSHEFGHHLGLGHQGSPGGPPGCGETIQAATMYGLSSAGDTSHRYLHIHDIAGVSVIYPVWKINGTVSAAPFNVPIENAALTADHLFAATVGGVESPQSGVFERPGYVHKTLFTDANGAYSATVIRRSFWLTASYFGFQSDSQLVQFGPPGGIGQTQTLTVDFSLQPSPVTTISGTLVDSVSTAPVSARIELWVTSDKPGAPTDTVFQDTTTSASGQFSFTVPADESYLLVIHPVVPYPVQTVAVNQLPASGVDLLIKTAPSQVLLVNDDVDEQWESIYQQALEANGMSYFTWRTSELGIPDTAVFKLFPTPNFMIWYTGDADTAVLNAAEQQALVEFLQRGGRLFLSGQNIAETDTGGVLLAGLLGVSFDKNIVPPRIRGVTGDLLGDGLVLSSVGGANNQGSKDAFLFDSTRARLSFFYGNSPLGNAGIRAEDAQQGWKLVYLGFGFEGINNDNGLRNQLLGRILSWFSGTVTGLETPGPDDRTLLSGQYRLHPNYPNPFNPNTTIVFSLPRTDRVRVAIFNALGQRIRVLRDALFPAGIHRVRWDATDALGRTVPTGIYLVQMRTESGFQATRKIMFLK